MLLKINVGVAVGKEIYNHHYSAALLPAGLVLWTCIGMRYWALSILLCTHTLKCRFVLFTCAFAQLEKSPICSYGPVDVEQSYRYERISTTSSIFMHIHDVNAATFSAALFWNRSESKMEIELRRFRNDYNLVLYIELYIMHEMIYSTNWKIIQSIFTCLLFNTPAQY